MTTENLMRAMALYDWIEDFDLPSHPEFVVELIQNSGIKPTKAEFHTHGKRNRRTIHKNSRLIDIIAQFKSYSDFEFCRPIGGNYLNLEFDIQYTAQSDEKLYIFSLPPRQLPLIKLLDHVRLFCRHMTPRYGFSHVMDGPAATFFFSGIAALSLSYDNQTRADDLGQTIRSDGAREHLSGKLHDVYELNVLSPAHLQRSTFGQTLASWIAGGKKRGQLVEINGAVSVWLVPDDVRPGIRSKFFKEGLLIATV